MGELGYYTFILNLIIYKLIILNYFLLIALFCIFFTIFAFKVVGDTLDKNTNTLFIILFPRIIYY